MYSTNTKDSRYMVECIVSLKRLRITKFIVDTGTMNTCCNYMLFDSELRKEDLADKEVKLLGGFVKGAPIEFYKCPLRQFTIGNIDMGVQYIWITFDGRVTDRVLGMDILQQMIFAADPFKKRLCFFKDVEDFNNNFELEAV